MLTRQRSYAQKRKSLDFTLRLYTTNIPEQHYPTVQKIKYRISKAVAQLMQRTSGAMQTSSKLCRMIKGKYTHTRY